MNQDFLGGSGEPDTNAPENRRSLFTGGDQFETMFDEIISTDESSQPQASFDANPPTTDTYNEPVYLTPDYQAGQFHHDASTAASHHFQGNRHHQRTPSTHSDASSIALKSGPDGALISDQASPMYFPVDVSQTTGLEQLTQNFTLLDDASGLSTASQAHHVELTGLEFPHDASTSITSPSAPEINFPISEDILQVSSNLDQQIYHSPNEQQDFMTTITFPETSDDVTPFPNATVYPSNTGVITNEEQEYFSTTSMSSVDTSEVGEAGYLSPSVPASHFSASNASSPGRMRSHSDSSVHSSSSMDPSKLRVQSPSLFLSPGSQAPSPGSPAISQNGYLSPNLAPTTISAASSPSSGNQLNVPGAEVRRARSTSSTRSRSSSSRSRSRSQTRDYLLELASPSPSSKRVQKHPSVYGCHLCDKRFTRAYNLRSHLRTHTDERPFVCGVCGKAFARQHDRKRHEALHSGEKKFECKGLLSDGRTEWGCGRKFARADALGRHFRTDAGKECIRPLVEEDEKLKINGDPSGNGGNEVPIYLNDKNSGTPALMLSPPESSSSPATNSNTRGFPTALLQQFPSLGNISWDNTSSNELDDD